MRICRYQLESGGPVRVGLVEKDSVYDVTAVAGLLPTWQWPYPAGDQFIANLEILRPAIIKAAKMSEPLRVEDVLLKCPVANPGKFVCGVGNHKTVLDRGGHPRDLGLLFKMTSAAGGASDGVAMRWTDRVTFHEIELAIVIGKGGTLIPRGEALAHVAGYAIGLDMTMQGKEFPSFCKSFDSYGVIGPWLVTADEIPDPTDLNFELTVNGVTKTADTTANFVLDVADLIEHVASIMTLHPGDVLFSGTPPNQLGPVVPGDVMHARFDRIGEMTVTVAGAEPGTQPIH